MDTEYLGWGSRKFFRVFSIKFRDNKSEYAAAPSNSLFISFPTSRHFISWATDSDAKYKINTLINTKNKRCVLFNAQRFKFRLFLWLGICNVLLSNTQITKDYATLWLWKINWKICAIKWSWPILMYYPNIRIEGLMTDTTYLGRDSNLISPKYRAGIIIISTTAWHQDIFIVVVYQPFREQPSFCLLTLYLSLH
jgi:hypothetical protein